MAQENMQLISTDVVLLPRVLSLDLLGAIKMPASADPGPGVVHFGVCLDRPLPLVLTSVGINLTEVDWLPDRNPTEQ
jgi:hypothetical protein